MSEWKVGLTQSAMDDSEHTIQCLIEASNEIFKSSEADFKAMKSKKWYNRLWEVITFSKDNEKKLAHGVSNLAKLQEIVTKAMLILSNKSAEIAAVVAENASSIQRLSQNQVAVIKELEKLKYGFDRPINLADLGDNKLYIVVNTLAKVALETNASEQGKQYVQTILKAVGFSSIDTSLLWGFLEQLDSDEMTLLYQILEEYLYLATNSFESDSEAFDYISLSPRKCQKIQQRIRETELIAGADFFLEFYKADEYGYTVIDETGLDFSDSEAISAATQDVMKESLDAAEHVVPQKQMTQKNEFKEETPFCMPIADIFDWKNDKEFALANGIFEDKYYGLVLSSETDGFNRCEFRNFPKLYAEDKLFYNCVFENCGEITVEECKVHNSTFRRIESIFARNTCIENSQFYELKAEGEEDYAIFLEDSNLSECSFNDIELRDDAWLCDAVGDCFVEHCTFTNCRTERSDRELFHCEETVGKIFKRKKEFDIVDDETQKSLENVAGLD